MNTFWMITAVLIVLALGFVLWPLLRRASDPFVGRAAAVRAQLHTLELAERDGLLSAEDAATRRDRLKSELLVLLEQPATGQSMGGVPSRNTVLVLAAVIPLLTVVLYRQFGTPHALLFAGVPAATTPASGTTSGAAATEAGNTQGPDLRAAAEALAQRLADRPEDAEGWTLLARSWQELGEFALARDAFAKVYALKSDDPDVISDYAQALGLASSPRSLLGQPRELLEQALKINPQHQRSMWLYGYALRQAGELPQTLELWNRLLAQMPEGSAEAGSLTEQINVVRAELGQAALPVPSVASAAAPPEPTATDQAGSASAAGAGLRVRVELDPALSENVAPGDVLYVFARAESGPPMPLAIQRVTAGQLPFAVTLTDAMAMTPAMKLSSFPQVIVGARISKSGNATASSGDLQGFSAAITQPYGDEVRVVIADRVP